VNENTGNSGNEFFYDLLDNPADLSHSNAFNLQLLINDFPQSGLLRAMLAVKREEESLHSASAYVNPRLLYKIANAVDSLRAVSDEQIAICQAPGEAKPVLPLPAGLELPNLIIDESNYFHVPIDRDLVYIEDEKAEDIALLEEDQVDESTDQNVESATIDQNAEHYTEVAEEYEPQEDVIPSSENDTEVAGENEAEEDATPSSKIDTEVINENEQEAQTDAAPVQTETVDENQAEIDGEVAPVSESEVEEIAEAGEEPAVPAEPVAEETTDTEEIQYPETGEPENVEEELSSEQAFVQPDQPDTENTPDTGQHQHMAFAEQTDNPTGETEDSKIGVKPTQSHQEIDDEVFEEIVSIEDIGLEQLALMDKVTDEAEQNATNDLQETTAGDSYFVFEPTLPEDEEYHAPANIATQNAPGNKNRQHVSRYNDEKMPYSFMWWLDKTRKEHASIYQPFAAEGKFHTETVAAVEKPQPATDHLQQQYVENIFAVSAVVSDLNVIPQKADAPAMETKADKIIEKFIHEEPQIKHPSKVKLDSENKAKKSSEDRDELVTETLAKIYTEQMLYHKAILTYKKLMLKFPEKSLYFAGQIEQLENKIN
jgi:hypothetical protein